uniref:Uncharacterized protein n=1 Tax=Ornithorhynchus anatinus TaxID=9258 RepID=A0A6I8PAY6_ORNAN
MAQTGPRAANALGAGKAIAVLTSGGDAQEIRVRGRSPSPPLPLPLQLNPVSLAGGGTVTSPDRQADT